MLAHDRRSTLDLTRWLGPLSPAFADLAADPGPVPRDGANGSPASAAAEPAYARPASTTHVEPDRASELRSLFHTLNNQLGVILTYAELLEAKAPDEGQRARAAQIVSAAIDALGTTKALRNHAIE